MSSRTQLQHPVSGAVTEYYSEDMHDGHGERVFARRANRSQIVVDGAGNKKNPVEEYVVYWNPNTGNPVGGPTLPEFSTSANISTLQTSSDGRRIVDLYASKPGWSFCDVKKWTEFHQRAAAMGQARAAANAARTPEAQNLKLATEVAAAVAREVKGTKRGGSDG